MGLIPSAKMHSRRIIIAGGLIFDEKRKKEAITAQKHDRASVVNCPFFDQKMF